MRKTFGCAKTGDPDQLNESRLAVGLPAEEDDPPETESTPQTLAEYREWLSGYEKWLRKAGLALRLSQGSELPGRGALN